MQPAIKNKIMGYFKHEMIYTLQRLRSCKILNCGVAKVNKSSNTNWLCNLQISYKNDKKVHKITNLVRVGHICTVVLVKLY